MITKKIDKLTKEITETMIEKAGYKRLQLMKDKDKDGTPRLIADELIIDGENKIIEFFNKLKGMDKEIKPVTIDETKPEGLERLDCTKITTLEEVKLILQCMDLHVSKEVLGASEYEKIKHLIVN